MLPQTNCGQASSQQIYHNSLLVVCVERIKNNSPAFLSYQSALGYPEVKTMSVNTPDIMKAHRLSQLFSKHKLEGRPLSLWH